MQVREEEPGIRSLRTQRLCDASAFWQGTTMSQPWSVRREQKQLSDAALIN